MIMNIKIGIITNKYNGYEINNHKIPAVMSIKKRTMNSHDMVNAMKGIARIIKPINKADPSIISILSFIKSGRRGRDSNPSVFGA